jgi:succinate-semialdehyde dehydrogenase/glutarate-semialdehyde dehydrogenase
MKFADGFEPGAVIGPLIDMKAVEKVEAHIADAVKKGPRSSPTASASSVDMKSGRQLSGPTVLTDVTIEMVITREETFGPVAPLYRFKTDAEALEYGIVGINEGIISPKSRWRDRAVRRHEGKRHRPNLADHWGSKYGIEEFLEVKYLCMGGIDR